MEWVEKTGKSVEEAKERALDQLGVSEHDAELVVLAEPKSGLFGRVRGEARVRARVRPAEPRQKRTRRQRDRSRGAERAPAAGRAHDAEPVPGSRSRAAVAAEGDGRSDAGEARSPRGDGGGQRSGGGRGGSPAGEPREGGGTTARRRRRGGSGGRGRVDGGAGGSATPRAPDDDGAVDGGARTGHDRVSREERAVADGITLQEQAEVAKEFLEGLLDLYGFEATVATREVDAETVELSAHGEGLGVLVGPKGATVAALQDLTRTVVQKHFPNKTDRILVDVAGYRERRVAALQRFTAQVAAEVLESGAERALEPMSAADRKVVHDAAVTIDGVVSSSQGEDPHRFVVISPSS